MTEAQGQGRESIPGLAKRLISGFVQLAKLEVTRGRQEIGEMVAEAKVGGVLIGIGAAFGLLALISLDLFFVLGVAALFEAIPPLASAIIIVATFALLAVGLAIASALNAFVVVALLIGAAAFAIPAYLGFHAAWLAALFVLVVELLAVVALVLRGIRHIRVQPPQETIESVKEDIAWAKRLLKRG